MSIDQMNFYHRKLAYEMDSRTFTRPWGRTSLS